MRPTTNIPLQLITSVYQLEWQKKVGEVKLVVSAAVGVTRGRDWPEW